MKHPYKINEYLSELFSGNYKTKLKMAFKIIRAFHFNGGCWTCFIKYETTDNWNFFLA